jgi:amino acid adenylation domain-containing protein
MSTANVEDIYGLSPMQFGMLFHTLQDDGVADPYLVQMTERITGSLDEERYLDAWQRVVDRHSILRSAFLWRDVSTPVQVVQRTARLPRQILDWRDLDPDGQDARLRQLAADDRRQGFDLSRAPLLRVRVIRTAEDAWLVLWSFHHMLLDGWSIQLVKQELYGCYRAAADGREAVLPPPIPYVRYATWLHEQDPAQARQFWRGYLQGISAPTELPVTQNAGSGVADLPARLGPELSGAVRRFAAGHRITVNTVIQGAWAALLSRYTGQDDVMFGATTSGRSAGLPGIESMVGLFINTLPARVRLDDQAPVAQWLRELQLQQIELRQFEHSHLIDVQACSDVPRDKPLFQSIVVFENYPELHGPDDWPDGLDVRLVDCAERTGYPITVVASAGEVLDITFAYDRGLFDRGTIEQLAGHLRMLLAGFAADPDAPLSRIPMLTPAERELVVGGWNDTAGPWPQDQTIHGLVRARAASCPEAAAVTCGDQEVSFAGLMARADQLAGYLRQEHGAGPGTLVGVFLDRGPDMVTALLAILIAGAAYVPLDPDYPPERLAYMLADTAAPLVITQRELAGQLPDGPAARLILDEQRDQVAAFPPVPPAPLAGPGDLAYVIYTSGSTGKPKGVMIEHAGVVNYLHWCDQAYPARDGTGTLLYSPAAFDLTVTAQFLPLIQGLPIGIPLARPGESAFAAAVDALLDGTAVSFLKMTPSHAELLVASAEAAGVTLAVTTMVLGGEELTADLARRILAACPGTVIYNEYGATEGSVANVMSATAAVPATAAGGIPAGTPITNTTVYVVDRHGHPVPAGVPGEALLGGICVARGYLGRPDLTAARFITTSALDGTPRRVYRTGDLCRWLPGGQLEFLGRLDTQVKLRGYRIELGEIENTLTAHPAITAAAVTVREDTPGARRLAAYTVTAAGATPPGPAALAAHAARTLPAYMIPATWTTLPRLPLTPNGKTDRAALPAPAAGRTPPPIPPRTPAEHAIAAIWQDILGTPGPGIHDNFFDEGGHSLRAVKVVSLLRKAGWPATLQQVMRHPTIGELARVLEGGQAQPSGLVSEVRPARDPDPERPGHRAAAGDRPFLFCIHPGGGQIHSYQALADELSSVFRVLGVQAAGLAEGEAPLEEIEAMAERYWKEIRNVQPEGACHLLGWSTGAVVVHEMTVMRPDETASAFLLEPAVTGPAREPRFSELAGVFAQAETLWRRGQDETGAARERTGEALGRLARPMNIGLDAVNLEEWLPYNVLRAESRALAGYRATAARAPVTLVVSDEIGRPGQELMPGGNRAQYIRHWQRLYPRGLNVLDLPGGHYDMVRAPEALADIARAVRNCAGLEAQIEISEENHDD